MGTKRAKGILLDVDYVSRGQNSVIRLFLREENGIGIYEDPEFRPYFFVRVNDLEKAKKTLKETVFGEGVKIKSIEGIEKSNADNVLKLSFENVQSLVIARTDITSLPDIIEKTEHDIPFAKRWLLDHCLEPMNGAVLEVEGKEIKKVELFEIVEPELAVAAFDLETYSPGRFSDPKKDPILMASFATNKKSIVLSYGKGFGSKKVECFENEKEMVKALAKRLGEGKLDVVATYNGDMFDFPYIKERSAKLGLRFGIGADGSEPKTRSKGRDNAVKVSGTQHLDVYQMLRFLSRFGVVNLIKFDLESVVARLFNVEKEKIKSDEINRLWDERKGIDRLAEYCAEDSEYTLKIAEQYLPLVIELCRLVKQNLFDVGRASASMLVEYLLMDKCRETKRLIANRA